MSDLSDSDSMEANDVTLALDRHLLSVLDGRLDLAAFLIPEIHDRMDEGVLPPACNLGLNFHRPVKYDDLEDDNAKGKQRASGPSQSKTGGRRLPPSSTRGEGSGDSQGCEDGGNRKRQRQSGGNSEGASGGDGGNGSASNRRGNTGKDPYRSPNRNPDDLGDDPGDETGDEPAPAESLDIPNFACPFYKLDPGKYGIWTDDKYKECPGSRITELRRIKYIYLPTLLLY